MNKYLHAVGLAVGLVAVIILSAFNGAFMIGSDNCLTGDFIDLKTFSLLWLISYVLSAFTIGEFLVNEKLKRKIPLVVAALVGTAGVFFGFYKIENNWVTIISLSLCLFIELFLTIVTIKATKYFWVFTITNFVWYTILLGIAIINLAR